MKYTDIQMTESKFQELLKELIKTINANEYDVVCGPGRSGALMSVYISHLTGIPFMPFKHKIPGKRVLIVDTTKCTGKTMQKALNWYGDCATGLTLIESPHKVNFWYESQVIRGGVDTATKQQRYESMRLAS